MKSFESLNRSHNGVVEINTESCKSHEFHRISSTRPDCRRDCQAHFAGSAGRRMVRHARTGRRRCAIGRLAWRPYFSRRLLGLLLNHIVDSCDRRLDHRAADLRRRHRPSWNGRAPLVSRLLARVVPVSSLTGTTLFARRGVARAQGLNYCLRCRSAGQLSDRLHWRAMSRRRRGHPQKMRQMQPVRRLTVMAPGLRLTCLGRWLAQGFPRA